MRRAVLFLALPAVLFLAAGGLLTPSGADAAFNPSAIIPDSYLTNTGTMSEQQIQQFLEQKGSYLANYYEPAHTGIGPSDNIDPYGWRASHVIWQVANWYGINPQVILATLQKEQSLVTDPAPESWALQWAMGYGCPDTADCSSYPGFSKQVDMGTWQLWFNKHYANLRDARVAPYLTGDTINIDGTNVYLSNGATASLYRYTPHFHGNQNFYNISTNWFDLDHFGPDISSMLPAGQTANNRPLIGADIAGSHIDPGAIGIVVDGVDVSSAATRATTHVGYRPPTPLAAGNHSVAILVRDSWNVSRSVDWQFTVSPTNYAPRDYMWTWYDGKSSRNWVLVANPVDAPEDVYADLYIGGNQMDLTPFAQTNSLCPGFCGSAQVGRGGIVTPSYQGLMGGPVDVASMKGLPAVTSQRILWGENSFEEVPGVDAQRLSSHYYWTWYDSQTSGYKNWVLVANPNNYPIYYEVSIAGSVLGSGTVFPGSNAAPIFSGIMGGPLEVQAWTSQSKGSPAKVMASQRVLMNNDKAFNEVMGIPAEELSDRYVWTWYDQVSAGTTNWLLLANQNSTSVFYEIRIAGQTLASGTLAGGDSVSPTFPGVMGGPVEVQAWTSNTKSAPADIIASQRVLWGPSFGESPGYATERLSSKYHWSWYDQASRGMGNWVMVANLNPEPVYYEIEIPGVDKDSWPGAKGIINPGRSVYPSFAGKMGGPLAVRAWTSPAKTAPADIFATQRVLYNGHFNELAGTVLD